MEEYIIKERGRQIEIILAVVASVFIFSIDFSMMNISLPTISRYFNVGIGVAAFLPLAYMLIVTSSLLGFGKLGDIRGYRKVFITGLIVFAAGSIACAFAPNMNALIALRMFQSLGEAMMSPMGVAILTTFLPARSRGMALGLVALTQGLGFALGNVLGGYINAQFIWRGIFFVNIPIAIFTILLAFKVLPTKQKEVTDRRFDTVGAAFIFMALAGLVYGLNMLGKLNISPLPIFVSFAVSFLGFILFFARERGIDYPVLDFTLFKNRNFTYSNLAAVMAVALLMGCIFIAPFYLEMVKRLSTMQTGAYLIIAPAVMLCVAPVAGRLSDHIGSRLLCSTGAALEGVAFTMFALMKPDSGIPLFIAALATVGLAAGIFMAPNNKLVMSHAPEDKQGVASGVYKICLSIGGVLGIAIFPVVIIQTIRFLMGGGTLDANLVKHSPEVLYAGFRNMFLSGVGIAIAAFVFSVMAEDRKI